MVWSGADVRCNPLILEAVLQLAHRMRIPIESSTSYRGRNSRPNLPALAGFLLLTFGVGAVGTLFSPGFSAAAHWYASLAKPAWLPPQSWFAPVWTGLYVLMAIAAWVIWRERYHR